MIIFDRLVEELKNGGIKSFLIKVQKRLLLPFSQFSYWICRYLPIVDNFIVFRTERDFWDNGWAFYQYLLHSPQAKTWKFIWLVDSPSCYPEVERTRFVSFSPIGVHIAAYYYIARTRFIFFTHGLSLVPLVRRNGQTVINLCHGCGYKSGKGVAKKLTANYDYAMVVGKFFVEPQAKFLHCESRIILPLGFPRNDVLLNNLGVGMDNPFISGQNCKKVLLWMPTYRAAKLYKLSELSSDNVTGLPLLDDDAKVLQFNDFLKSIHVVVILKIHYLQAEKKTFSKKFSNIVIIKDCDLVDRDLQLYQVVGRTDALLTDYSSIATDYLLADKPMGFILDDIDNYISDRGFVFDDVTSIMPGNHIYNIEQLYDFINAVVNDKDLHHRWRTEVRNKMYDYTDNLSSQRIAEYFGILQKKQNI